MGQHNFLHLYASDHLCFTFVNGTGDQVSMQAMHFCLSATQESGKRVWSLNSCISWSLTSMDSSTMFNQTVSNWSILECCSPFIRNFAPMQCTFTSSELTEPCTIMGMLTMEFNSIFMVFPIYMYARRLYISEHSSEEITAGSKMVGGPYNCIQLQLVEFRQSNPSSIKWLFVAIQNLKRILLTR